MAIRVSRNGKILLGIVGTILLLAGTAFALLTLTDLGEQIGLGDSSADSEACSCGGLNEGWCDEPTCQNNLECRGWAGAPCADSDGDGTFTPTNGGCEASQFHCSNTGSCIPENQCPSGGGNQELCETCIGSCSHTGCNVQCDGIDPHECGYFSGTHYCRGQRDDGCNDAMGFDPEVFPTLDPDGPFIGNGGSNVEVGQSVNLSYTPEGGATINVTTSTWCSTVQADSNAPNGSYSIVYIGDNGEICAEVDDGNGGRTHRDAAGNPCNPDELDWDCDNDPPDDECPGTAAAECLTPTSARLTWTNSVANAGNQIIRLDSDPNNNNQCMGADPRHFEDPNLPRYLACETPMCYNPATGQEAPASLDSNGNYSCSRGAASICPNNLESCVIGCPVGWFCGQSNYCLDGTSCELFDQYIVSAGTQVGSNPLTRQHTVSVEANETYAWSIQDQDTGCRIEVGEFTCEDSGTPQEDEATATGRVFCQDTGSATSYPVAGVTVRARVCPPDAPCSNVNVTTDASGNYVVDVPTEEGEEYSVDTSITTLPTGSLSTGQPFSSMIPNTSTPATGANFAINCTNGAECSGTGSVCGPNDSIGGSGTYAGCGVPAGVEVGSLDFRFTNCAAAPQAECMEECSVDSDCSGGLSCSGGMCISDECSVDDQDENCLCSTENPDWNMDKGHEISCQSDGSSSTALVQYTIRVSNSGDGEGILPQLIDTLDPDIDMSWVQSGSITPSYGVIVGHTIVWEIPIAEQSFDPGEVRDFSYIVAIPETHYAIYDNMVEGFPEDGPDFTADDSVDVTNTFCPDTPTSPPLPDTAIFDYSAVFKVLVGLVIVVGSFVYLTSDKYDVWFMRLMNKDERLDYTKEKFEKKVGKKSSK